MYGRPGYHLSELSENADRPVDAPSKLLNRGLSVQLLPQVGKCCENLSGRLIELFGNMDEPTVEANLLKDAVTYPPTRKGVEPDSSLRVISTRGDQQSFVAC